MVSPPLLSPHFIHWDDITTSSDHQCDLSCHTQGEALWVNMYKYGTLPLNCNFASKYNRTPLIRNGWEYGIYFGYEGFSDTRG